MSQSINENQLDDITHATAAALRAQGIALDNDKMTDLNDHISAFINGSCGYDIETSGPKKIGDQEDHVIQIAFDVVYGDAHQRVKIIDDNYDEESIIEGLKKGTLVTTTWHGDGPCELTVTETGKVIGLVLSQEINAEYEDFR
jgi:hypothetical protein